jgi:hypothetical protein
MYHQDKYICIDWQCVPKYYVCVPHTKGDIMKVKTLRVPEWLEKAFEELAVKSDRSFSKEAVRAMREYAERQGVKCPE